MSRVDLYADDFPHGSWRGYQDGCRGDAGCPNFGSDEWLTCRQAFIARQGQFNLVRAFGPADPVTRAAVAMAPEKPVKAPVKSKVAAERLPPEPRVRPAPVPKPASPAPVAVVPDVQPPKWRVARVWVTIAPTGRMSGPFESYDAALTHVGEMIRPKPTGKARIWTPAMDAEVRRGNEAGLSDAAIARGMGMSQQVVSRHRKALGLETLYRSPNRGGATS